MQLPPEAAKQSGMFSYTQARAAGISRRALGRAVQDGVLELVRQGVYRLAGEHPQPDHRAVVQQALLGLPPTWVASRRTGAALYGLPLIGQVPSTPQLSRDHGGKESQGTDRFRQVTSLPSTQTTAYDGLRLASPARVVVDVARGSSFGAGLVTADAALRRGVLREELDEVALGMRRWPGVRVAREVVRFADGRSESPGESLTRALHHTYDLPSVEPQVEVLVRGRVVARVDLLDRVHLIATEFNGAVKFTSDGALPALISRQEDVRTCGIDVLNTDWDEVFGGADVYAGRYRQRVRERGPRTLPPGVTLRSTVLRPVRPLLSAAALRQALSA